MGSAVTYSRRYGYTGMLGIAPDDGEDDDGEAARGGNHEMPSAPPERKPAPPRDGNLWCTNCGKQTVRPSKYPPGSYYCDMKAGGCNKKYTEAPPAPPDAPDGEEPVPF